MTKLVLIKDGCLYFRQTKEGARRGGTDSAWKCIYFSEFPMSGVNTVLLFYSLLFSSILFLINFSSHMGLEILQFQPPGVCRWTSLTSL